MRESNRLGRRCVLCSARAVFAQAAHGREYWACARCDLHFVPAEQHLPPDAERARYALHDNSMENKGYVRMFTRKIRVLRRIWQEVHSVLDFGCGPGPVLVELLRRIGYDASGYDPYFAPTLADDKVYDAVVSTETFEHFAAPGRELLRIAALIRPGGYLAVMTQFRPADPLIGEWWYAREPTHVAFYSRTTFHWIAAMFGFNLLYMDNKDFVVMRKSLTSAVND